MSERFYINWPLNPGPVEMTGPEARHLATVCRLRAGDALCLFNGNGHQYPARVIETTKKTVLLEILSVETPLRELVFHLEIAAPVPKGDRAQFLVEKLTELGVTSFIPLLCARSVVQPGEGKIDKLQRYVVEASKQCGRNALMCVGDPVDWATYNKPGEPAELRLIAHPMTAGSQGKCPIPAHSKIRCAIGPEGGFSDGEIIQASAAGWHMVDLGPRILRIETAAVVMAIKAIGVSDRGEPGA
jgi:16S rRNA (uracil1498-N3)-methyltransferase